MIVSVGEALIDFIPARTEDGRECFVPAPGGSPYNTAISVARLDVTTGFLGRISQDFFGDRLVSNLQDNNVDVSRIRRSPDPSTLAFVSRDADGNARYAFFANDSADRSLDISDVNEELPDEVEALQCGSISLVLEPGASTIVELIKRESQRRVVSFDPNVRASMITDRTGYISRFEKLSGLSTIVKISIDDLEWIYPGTDMRDCAYTLLALGTDLVVVTRGGDGASAFSKSGEVHVESVDTDIADTIGAGDSFHGGLLAYLQRHGLLSRDRIPELSEQEIEAALRFASQVSAVTCSRHGAQPPYLSEISDSER
jgi:fructokinase